MAALHEHTGSKVCHKQKLSAPFHTTSGVRQGCILAPALFCVATDRILGHMTAKPGIDIGTVTSTALPVTSTPLL